MGNTGSNSSAVDSIAFYNAHSHLARILMTLDHCNLLIFSVRSKIFLTIRFYPWNLFQNILCHNLFLKHLNHSCLCSRMFQFQTFLTEPRYMNCIFQIWRTWFQFCFLIFNDLLTTMIYIYNIQIYHIIQNDKICLSSGCDHSKSV